MMLVEGWEQRGSNPLTSTKDVLDEVAVRKRIDGSGGVAIAAWLMSMHEEEVKQMKLPAEKSVHMGHRLPSHVVNPVSMSLMGVIW